MDRIILVGTNPRTEARLLNTRLRAQVRAGLLKVSVIGPAIDLGYEYEHLGERLRDLEDLLVNNELTFLNESNNPIMILGTAPLYLKNGSSINRKCLNLIKQAHPSLQVNILNTGSNSVKGLQNQTREQNSNYIPGLYRLGLIFEAEGLPQDFTCCNNEIFVGSSLSDSIIQRSRIQLFLPRATHFEQKGSYMNMAGIVQTIKPIISTGRDCQRTVDIIS